MTLCTDYEISSVVEKNYEFAMKSLFTTSAESLSGMSAKFHDLKLYEYKEWRMNCFGPQLSEWVAEEITYHDIFDLEGKVLDLVTIKRSKIDFVSDKYKGCEREREKSILLK